MNYGNEVTSDRYSVYSSEEDISDAGTKVLQSRHGLRENDLRGLAKEFGRFWIQLENFDSK